MPRPLLLLVLVATLASASARADCELLFAPAEIRARLLAFHHANELRRAREQARKPVAGIGDKPAPKRVPARTEPDPGAGTTAPARPR